MINKIYINEIKYISSFSEKEILNGYDRFIDNNIKDMYSHNCIFIHPNTKTETIYSIIEAELNIRKLQNKTFVRIVTFDDFDSEVIREKYDKVEIDVYDCYGIKSDQYISKKASDGVVVKLANTDLVKSHGRFVDVVANYENMTLEFAIRRINRKFQIYSDVKKSVNLYVCYAKEEPVGNCELMIGDDIGKIEDFDIINMYQRKGYGTQVLRSLLKICNEEKVPFVYLVTDHDDTAKEMYTKFGFDLIGQFKEIMIEI